MDKNNDNYLSEKELEGSKELSAQMTELDKNKDKKLDQTEFGGFEATGGGAVR